MALLVTDRGQDRPIRLIRSHGNTGDTLFIGIQDTIGIECQTLDGQILENDSRNIR